MFNKLFCLVLLAFILNANVIHYHYHFGAKSQEGSKHLARSFA